MRHDKIFKANREQRGKSFLLLFYEYISNVIRAENVSFLMFYVNKHRGFDTYLEAQGTNTVIRFGLISAVTG